MPRDFFTLKRTLASCALLLALACPPQAAADQLALPDIGDSSTTAFTPADEERFGREIMRQIRQSGQMLDDPEVDEYIQQLGYRLVSAGGHSARGFTFFTLRDPSINAFAMPGGYIAIHTGLITASRTESELAGVMAHEIAHVTQHHLARRFEQAGSMSMPTMAAVLAAILLGASNPQLGEAALAATMAGSIQSQLDYSRSHEREADRVGMQMLAGAQFDPQGMPGFFERLQQEYRYANNSLPEFLSTHPVTIDRIADARNRAEQYPPSQASNSPSYSLIKARIEVLLAVNLKALERRYRETLEAEADQKQPATRYAYALVLQRLRDYTQSRALLTALLEDEPGRIAYRLALAETEKADGNAATADTLYQDGLKLHPGNSLLTLAYAGYLLDQNENARTAELLREHTRNRKAAPRAYELLAEAEMRSGRKGIAHIALADYYYGIGELQTAIEQLHLARKSVGLDFYYQSMLEAKLTDWQALLPDRKPNL